MTTMEFLPIVKLVLQGGAKSTTSSLSSCHTWPCSLLQQVEAVEAVEAAEAAGTQGWSAAPALYQHQGLGGTSQEHSRQ